MCSNNKLCRLNFWTNTPLKLPYYMAQRQAVILLLIVNRRILLSLFPDLIHVLEVKKLSEPSYGTSSIRWIRSPYGEAIVL